MQDKTIISKHLLRSKARALRAGAVADIPDHQWDTLADQVVEWLNKHDLHGQIIALYYAVGSEFPTLPLFPRLQKQGWKLALPATRAEGGLDFYLWEEGRRLQQDSADIPSPAALDQQAVIPAALLVPLLAFDAEGTRLGQGGGHYDRAIARLAPVPVLGLAWEAQQWQAPLPREAHDAPLEAVLTEKGLRYLSVATKNKDK
jgi:5-formyltetrahydrofolate cyclo-ligase